MDIAERLIGKGFNFSIFDKNVHISKLVGASKFFMEKHLPHLSDLNTDDQEAALNYAEVILLNLKIFDHRNYLDDLSKKEMLIDLVRIRELESMPKYVGPCW